MKMFIEDEERPPDEDMNRDRQWEDGNDGNEEF